eukprot:696537-Pelagomonas_calceolata.AAC.1
MSPTDAACLEEDALSNLETPCRYRGAYTVPPPQPSIPEHSPFGNGGLIVLPAEVRVQGQSFVPVAYEKKKKKGTNSAYFPDMQLCKGIVLPILSCWCARELFFPLCYAVMQGNCASFPVMQQCKGIVLPFLSSNQGCRQNVESPTVARGMTHVVRARNSNNAAEQMFDAAGGLHAQNADVTLKLQCMRDVMCRILPTQADVMHSAYTDTAA